MLDEKTQVWTKTLTLLNAQLAVQLFIRLCSSVKSREFDGEDDDQASVATA